MTIPALLVISCVTLGELLNLSVPQSMEMIATPT